MAATEPVFRVTTYKNATGDFGGQQFRLHLRYTLSPNYFVMLQWQVTSGGPVPPSTYCVRVTEDPYGTADLAQAGGNWLTLYRESPASGDADLVVTVVECLTAEDSAGFKLLSVENVSLAAFASTGKQTTTDTSATSWVNTANVVLFGGYRGGGLSTVASGSDQVQTAGCRVYPSGSNQINVERYASTNTKVQAAVLTVYVVEWGSEWTVQRATVTGTNWGATLDNTGHYSTTALGLNIARANTWVWGCGYTDGSGPGDCFLGQVFTIGDGVASNVTESTVAVGCAFGITVRNWDVVTMTHAKLSASWVFHAAAVGAYSFTVAAPASGVETYPAADTLYEPTTVGQRLATLSQSVNMNIVNDLGEIFFAVAVTASTTVSATVDDPVPAQPWMGWMTMADFVGVVVNTDSLPVFRVTTYRISGASFSGATYDLALAYPLQPNYFVMIEGAEPVSGATPDPDDCAAYVSQDPYGTGDLAVSSSSSTLRLARTASSNPWRGTVVVVECLRGSSTSGFRLVDVRSVALPAFADTGVQTVLDTLTAGSVWTDPRRVVLFAGWRGGGVQTVGAHIAGDIQSLGVAPTPRGTNGLQLQRYTNNNAKLKAVNVVVYAVEWGSEWTVQQVIAAAAAGGTDVNAPSEYQTFSLDTTVKTAQSWVWAGVTAEDDETFHSFLSASVALGDGVTVGAQEGRVAIGLWAADAYLASVYVLTHPSLVNTWTFQASVTSAAVSYTVPTGVRSEGYTKAAAAWTVGYRFGQVYAATSEGSGTNIAAAALQAQFTSPIALAVIRDRNDGNWAGWVQATDLGALFLRTSAIQVDDSVYPTPQAYLILQDPLWVGSDNVVSATSQAGRMAGPVDPDTGNGGAVVGFQDGTPSADTGFDYHLFAGAVGGSGGWLYRLISETTSADWKSMNALTTLWRQQSWTSIGDPPTQKLYAQDVTYSQAYQRLVGVWIHSDGTVRTERQDTGDIFGAWTSGTIGMGGFGANTGKETGLGVCELPDGSLLCLYQQEDSVTGWLNINAFLSSDGAATWSTVQTRILTRTSSGSVGSSGGQYQVRSSGDWVRAVWCGTSVGIVGYTSTAQKTIVSPDRGASWSYLSTLTAYSWRALTGYAGSAPTSLVGLGDASGTFLFAYLTSHAPTVSIAIAARDDDWEQVVALDWDCSSYATSAEVKGLAFVRDPDRIWLFAWIEGTDKSEIIARICTDPTDPENADNWTTLGQISGMGGVMRYGPHCFRGVWAGNRIVLSGGLQDPDVSGATDPVVAGHWMLQSGSWDPRPWDYTNLDPVNNDYLVSGARLVEYQWQPCMGDPAGGGGDSDGLTPWTRTTSGGTTTFTWSKNRVRMTTSDATGIGRYNLALGVPSAQDRWGGGMRGFTWQFGLKSIATRAATGAAEDSGVRIKALDSGGVSGYDFSLRITPTAVALIDNFGGPATKVTVATTDFASDVELRITLKGTSLSMAWRLKSAGTLAQWTVYGPYTITNAALAAQELRVGILANPATAGTSTIEWFELTTSYETDAGQRTDVVKPTNLMGTKLNRGPVLVANGVRVRWGGSGAYQADGFTGSIEFARGVKNWDLDSPRFFWESTSLVEQDIVLAANPDATASRWHINAWLLVGTVDRTCRLQFSNTNSVAAWLAPAVDVELSADLYTDLTVAAIDGSSFRLQAATGQTFSPRRGEGQLCYVRFVAAGTATGATLQVKNDVHDNTWWQVADGVDLTSIGVTIGSKCVIYGDRMLYLGTDFSRHQFARLVFPDLSGVASSRGTYTGTHRLGSMVPGFWQRFTVPMEWTFTDNSQPNVTELRTKGGASWHYEEGPAQRVISGKCVGDVNQFRRALRDLLRKLHAYSVRPVGLLLDSQNVTPDTLLYGRVSSGSQMDEAAWYKDSEGEWRTAGDTDITITEEV